jgi:glycosyltransferase involved in cell wall biosynthesis
MHAKMLDLTLKDPNQHRKPDYFVQVTIPLEFKAFGEKSIGITAGIETNRVAAEWVQAANTMDCMIVPSEHSKNVHLDSTYEIKQQEGGPTVGTLQSEKPVEVLFEGVNTDIYKGFDSKSQKSQELKDLYDIPEKFAFLYVGHWLPGPFRQDRKDVGGLIYNFIQTFNYKKGEVALIMKTSGGNFSLMDRRELEKKINDIRNMFPDRDKQPNIYIVHGNLTDEEMNELYNMPKVKAMVSLTHGEGYGRPLAEFACATGKPTMAPFWSGQVDFLREGGNELLFDYDMADVPQSAHWEKIIIPESKWCNVRDADVVSKLTRCFYSYDDLLEPAAKVQSYIQNNMTFDHMREKFLRILDGHKPPVQSDIILPGISAPGAIDISKLKGLKR